MSGSLPRRSSRAVSTGLLLALAMPALSADVSTEETADRPPILLRDGRVVVPPDLLADQPGLEVEVRMELDRRGRPETVEIGRVRPSSAKDEEVAATVREVISDWRYAPKLVGGVAEPATLNWTIRFHSSGTSETVSVTAAGPASVPLAEAESQREELARRVLELPAEQRARMLESLADQARGHLDPATTERASTAHFVVYSDSRQRGTAQIIANNLETVFSTLVGLFDQDVPLYPERYKLVAVVYSHERQLERLRASQFNYDWAAGFYHPAGLIAFHLEVSTPGQALSLLIHEATHAFVDRHVVRPGMRIPTWLNEGFADYIGNSRIRRRQLDLGAIAPRELYLTMYGLVVARTESVLSLSTLRDAMRRGRAPTVEQILQAQTSGFYGGSVEEVRLHYAFAWLLVHFLRHGETSWADGAFPRLLLYTGEGYPADSVIEELYALHGEALETAFREYVRKL